jgi:hypothetical protein
MGSVAGRKDPGRTRPDDCYLRRFVSEQPFDTHHPLRDGLACRELAVSN